MTMHRKFIALIVGTALAVTSLTTTPAQAQSRGETTAIIAGVAALAILGAAVADDRDRNRDRDRRRDYAARDYGYQQQYRYAPKNHHKHHPQNFRNHGHAQHHYKPHRQSQNRYQYDNHQQYRSQHEYHETRRPETSPIPRRARANTIPYNRDDHRN
ncbi:hypothetical protein [Roseovarius sp.]|uniref:hypothetical protein n=1 Tax=Roseovarius sp. TaxID=1486281 RepID=UPI003A975B74